MQEYAYNVLETMVAGLVPHANYPPGVNFASKMRNLRPQEFAAVNPEWFTAPFDFELDWPFPQLFRGESVTLLFHEDGIGELDADWDETALALKKADSRGVAATLEGSGVWHAACYEDVWLASNGTDLVFRIPAYPETLVAQGLTCRTLCGHGNRLVLAGLTGDWFSGDRFIRLFQRWRQTQLAFAHDEQEWSARWVVWSDPGARDVAFWLPLVALGVFGTAAFDVMEAELLKRVETGQIGFASVRSLGTPLRVLPHRAGVTVYSAEGRAMLTASDSGYTVEPATGSGCASRSCITGDENGHAWLTPSGRLLEWTAEAGLRDHRQEARFPLPENWVASLDPSYENREYWFSKETEAYVLNAHGVGGPMDVCPTGLARADGVLVGAGAGLDAETVAVELYMHPHDIGYRGMKRVQAVEIAQSGLTALQVDVKVDGVTTGAVQANEYGVGFPLRSGNELSVGAKGTADVGDEYAIKRCTVRYQSEDRRFRRGSTAAPAGAAPDA
jgi:hypothetical protein